MQKQLCNPYESYPANSLWSVQSVFSIDSIDKCSKVGVDSSEKPVFNKLLADDFVASGRTAIFRSGPSAPISVLLKMGVFTSGSALNFGKGRYDFDTDAIKSVTSHCVGYDYTFSPNLDLLGCDYGFVYAGYVVNTLPPAARSYVWRQMKSCCKAGIVFVAARTDIINGKPSEDGVFTSIGTFQKSYRKKELLSEALGYFKFAVELKGKSGFSIVACSNVTLPEVILRNSKK